jgi:hypothetical protein
LGTVAVEEITAQPTYWNKFSAQRGAVTFSQGGFLIGPGIPDVAYTPLGVCSVLTQVNINAPFCPTFVVKVDDFTIQNKLDDLTAKIKDLYFPSGVQLAWLIDLKNKISRGRWLVSSTTVLTRGTRRAIDQQLSKVVMCCRDFEPQLSEIDKVYTVVRSFYLVTSLFNLYGLVSAKRACCWPKCSIHLLAMQQIFRRGCSYQAPCRALG